uniref:Uncharacterized protein n=1 Tax=Plectus sambesii TaxID=2011161 RepID=A0A914XM33_9BILA
MRITGEEIKKAISKVDTRTNTLVEDSTEEDKKAMISMVTVGQMATMETVMGIPDSVGHEGRAAATGMVATGAVVTEAVDSMDGRWELAAVHKATRMEEF